MPNNWHCYRRFARLLMWSVKLMAMRENNLIMMADFILNTVIVLNKVSFSSSSEALMSSLSINYKRILRTTKKAFKFMKTKNMDKRPKGKPPSWVTIFSWNQKCIIKLRDNLWNSCLIDIVSIFCRYLLNIWKCYLIFWGNKMMLTLIYW